MDDGVPLAETAANLWRKLGAFLFYANVVLEDRLFVRLTRETFEPKVSPGGFVVIDDYGTWEGACQAELPSAMPITRPCSG